MTKEQRIAEIDERIHALQGERRSLMKGFTTVEKIFGEAFAGFSEDELTRYLAWSAALAVLRAVFRQRSGKHIPKQKAPEIRAVLTELRALMERHRKGERA